MWLKPEEVHQCELPEFRTGQKDLNEDHALGDYWQCESSLCGQLWKVVGIHRNLADKTGKYRFQRVINHPPRKTTSKSQRVGIESIVHHAHPKK